MASFTDFEILISGSTGDLKIFLRDPLTEDLTDVVAPSTFQLIDLATNTVEVSDTFTAAGGTAVNRVSEGVYTYALNTTTYDGEYLALFDCVLNGKTSKNNIFVKSVSARQFSYAARLRATVDKARKSVSDHIENMDQDDFDPAVELFFGYDDKHLIYYLERAVQMINAVPPTTGLDLDSYPFDQYGDLLLTAATIASLEAQTILSIDTDYNYSLGGNAFVIDHYSKLSSFITGHLMNKLNTMLINFKSIYRRSGTVMSQLQPGGFRTARLLNALPSGFWSRMLSSVFH